MISTAKEIQCSYEAGLVLSGQDEGKPVFSGTPKQWTRYGQLMNWVDQVGAFPWIISWL